MPEYSTIMFAVTDKVAHLTLNRSTALKRPTQLNATASAEMMDAMWRRVAGWDLPTRAT
jgi:hypothetical protein